MITKNMARFMAKFESEMAHKSIEETIADMCHETSVEISKAFGYEI